MYHGIVTGHVPVTQINRKERLYQLTFNVTGELVNGLRIGSSVCIDGVCLTVTNIEGTSVSFDVMGETLDCSTLKLLDIGSFVNIERSARSGDEIGGHLLSGHVDGLAQIIRIEKPVNNYILTCSIADNLVPYVFRKGYIGLNGASLTIANIDRDNNWFCVHLIPETLRITTFGMKKIGDFLNVEIDRNTQVLVDTVNTFLTRTNYNLSYTSENNLIATHL